VPNIRAGFIDLGEAQEPQKMPPVISFGGGRNHTTADSRLESFSKWPHCERNSGSTYGSFVRNTE
jgi:hypothetical protein